MTRPSPVLAAASSAALVAVLLASGAARAQTPEQRYTDWASLDFRPQEYLFRRNRMLELLQESGGGILLVPSSDGRTEGTTFRQLDDFWYLTGLEVPGSLLVLDAGRRRSILFMPERDPRFEDAGRPNDFPGMELVEDFQLRGISGMDEYEPISQLKFYLDGWAGSTVSIRLDVGREGEAAPPEIPLIGSLDPVQTLYLRLVSDHPNVRVENAYEQIAHLRMVKSPAEIRHLRIAADATAEGIRRAAAAVRPGRDERSVQGIFEDTCRSLGAQAMAFTPIVKSGRNSLWPWRILASHYDRRNRPMESDELVILDVGCEVNGYVSDVGRTFPVGGTFSPDQRAKLELTTSVADAIIAAVRPGVTLRELTQIAYDVIPDDEEPYMQTPSYFGHHIGLSAGDPSLLDEPLAEGMAITVEPWYYNHDDEIAVFVEDVVLVTADGHEVLTSGLPRTPDELEAMVP